HQCMDKRPLRHCYPGYTCGATARFARYAFEHCHGPGETITMSGLTQIATVCAMNIRNLPQRLGSSSVAIFGVACVVGVFIGVLSMASGFQRTMTMAGSDTTAIVMRSGATSELSSGMGYEETQLIAQSPGVLKRDGQPVTSAE